MKLARIYIKPAGEKWLDLPLRPDQDLGIVFQAMNTEGVLISPSAFCVPKEQVHHMVLLNIPDPPAGTELSLWSPGQGSEPGKAN